MNNNPPIIDTGDTSTPPAFAPDAQAQQFVAPEPEKKKGSVGTIIFAILFVLALAGAGYMFYMNMEANKQVDDLTKKNKDLTAQLAEKGEEDEDEDEEEPAKGDITGDLLTEVVLPGVNSLKFKAGLDGVSQILDITTGGEEIAVGKIIYYRSGPGAEWKKIFEGNGMGECLFYDEGVAAAFGENLPCTAPAEDAPEETPEETPEEPADESAAE